MKYWTYLLIKILDDTTTNSTAVPVSCPRENEDATTSKAAIEHRRLFNFGGTRHLVNKGKHMQNAKAKAKQPATKFKFVCLTDTTACCPPSSVKEKTDLCNAGLGDTTILLEINYSSVYLHEEILKTFPKLNETGGYELLLHQRGGGDNGRFHVIKPPPPPLLQCTAKRCLWQSKNISKAFTKKYSS